MPEQPEPGKPRPRSPRERQRAVLGGGGSSSPHPDTPGRPLPPRGAPQMLPILIFLLLPLASSVAGLGITARTLSPCYSADLRPASGSLVSAVGCTVLFTVPPLRAGKAVSWEYRAGGGEGPIVSYSFDGAANTSRPYANRSRFNETDLSLQIVLQAGDERLYRLRAEEGTTGWFQLRVVEPLPEPEIVGNSSVKAGGDARLVCSVPGGRVDSYRWKKNGEVLVGSERVRVVGNSTLCILKASMNDSGYYHCVVRNEVSQTETSFLLHVENAPNVVLPVILVCVAVGSLAGVFVWCRRRNHQRP